MPKISGPGSQKVGGLVKGPEKKEKKEKEDGANVAKGHAPVEGRVGASEVKRGGGEGHAKGGGGAGE